MVKLKHLSHLPSFVFSARTSPFSRRIFHSGGLPLAPAIRTVPHVGLKRPATATNRGVHAWRAGLDDPRPNLERLEIQLQVHTGIKEHDMCHGPNHGIWIIIHPIMGNTNIVDIEII